MRVAFDQQIFAAQRYGGISRYFFELATRLPPGTVSEVVVVAPLHINYYLSQQAARRFTRGRYVPYTFRGHTQLISLVNKLVEPLAWRGVAPDIVHETYFSRVPIGKARRRIVTVYDMIHELFPAEFPDAATVTAAKRAAVERADHVICISESTQKDLTRLFDLTPTRTSVVHLGHSMTAGHAAVTPEHVARDPVILYVGHRGGYKNFQRLVLAYASSPLLRAEFELVAFGGPPFSTRETGELDRLGVRATVHHRSGPDDELAARYRAATVFVCPSLYEGFGIPPLEAMSHGCPVISSDRASLPEVIGDAGIYFDPTSIEAMRATLERVATTPSLQTELRTRGYGRIKAFSWDSCAAATARIYAAVS